MQEIIVILLKIGWEQQLNLHRFFRSNRFSKYIVTIDVFGSVKLNYIPLNKRLQFYKIHVEQK